MVKDFISKYPHIAEDLTSFITKERNRSSAYIEYVEEFINFVNDEMFSDPEVSSIVNIVKKETDPNLSFIFCRKLEELKARKVSDYLKTYEAYREEQYAEHMQQTADKLHKSVVYARYHIK